MPFRRATDNYKLALKVTLKIKKVIQDGILLTTTIAINKLEIN